MNSFDWSYGGALPGISFCGRRYAPACSEFSPTSSAPAWTLEPRGGGAAICAFGDRLFAGGSGSVSCVDLHSGNPIWKEDLEAGFNNSIAVNGDFVCFGDHVLMAGNGEPVFDFARAVNRGRMKGPDQSFFVGSTMLRMASDQRLYENREVHKVGLPVGENEPLYRITNSVNCFDQLRGNFVGLSVGHPGMLCGINSMTGEVIWTSPLPIFGDGKINLCPNVACDEELIYYATREGDLAVLDATTGEPCWRLDAGNHTTSSTSYRVGPSPKLLLGDGRIVVVNSRNPERPEIFSTVCIDLKKKSVKWRFEQEDWGLSSACILGNYLFGIEGQRPTAWDLASGEQVWQCPKTLNCRSILAQRDRVVYLTTDGLLVCFGFSRD